MPSFDVVTFINDYESGELTREEVIEGFQELVNSGLVWELQGNYHRTACKLIDSGEVICNLIEVPVFGIDGIV